MTFRDFIQAICNVTGEEFRPATAQTFLLAVTKDRLKATINSIKPSTFNSYLREGRNLSRSFACEIEADYIPTELKEYLNDMSKGRGGKQRLCDAFREYCPTIEPKNAIKQIVKLFEQMLLEAKQSRRTRAKADAAEHPSNASEHGKAWLSFERTDSSVFRTVYRLSESQHRV